MEKKYFEEAFGAYCEYISSAENIEQEIIDYLSERIKLNKDMIEKLLEITNEPLDILKVQDFFNKKSLYKKHKTFKMTNEGFVNGTLITGKGVILKEESLPEKVIEAYIDAILSRNAVVISDEEYSEISVKNLFLEIMQIALEKFDVDKNLIQLLPADEIVKEDFWPQKENKNKYIYLENKEFAKEVDKQYLIEGELDEVIEKINGEGVCDCAVIYTEDRNKAYKFINMINSKNVFVNARFENMLENIEIDEWYIHKNVIYPTT